MNRQLQKVLIFAAHPDDEVLGCGGVIQHWVKREAKVYVCIVTEGSSSQYPNDQSMIDKKKRHAQKANQILGVHKVIFLDLPDMRLDTVPHVILNRELESVINHIKPDIIYTHSASDLNLDHQKIHYSTLVATRPFSSTIKTVYAYEVPSSSEQNREEPFTPNVFLNIEPYIKKKLRAMNCYTSELKIYPHPRSLLGIETLARYRGMSAYMLFAEAFQLLLSYEA